MRKHENIRTQISTLAVALVLTFCNAAFPQDAVDGVNQARSLSQAFRRAARIAGPSVVTIITQVDRTTEVLRDGFVVSKVVPENSSIGSGVVIHPSGVVMTNSHVVAAADHVLVRIHDGREFATKDLRRDKQSDIAILKIIDPPDSLTATTLGNSDDVEIGDWVIAIGSPFELQTTVSAGIISGKDRDLDKIERGKLLQTDAAINPGNSGGPLVNLDGEVIGINTAIASNSGGYQGVGFAIPVNSARWVVNQLAKNGKVQRSYLGVAVDNLPVKDAVIRGLPPVAGVLVREVKSWTRSAGSGLQQNDVILEFAGKRVRDVKDLLGAVERKPVGSIHTVKVLRNGQSEQVQIEVQQRPSPHVSG